MKPKHSEVRRILNLALVCWTDFLNELNNILLSKSHIPNQSFFEEVYQENKRDEIREAIYVISSYWKRISKEELLEDIDGLQLSKPHVVYLSTSFKRPKHHLFFPTLERRVRHEINRVETPVWLKDLKNFSIKRPSKINKQEVLTYDEKILLGRTYPHPYVRAGIDLQLIRRGFKL